MSLGRFFTAHPASVGETYLEHMGSAGRFAGHLAAAAVVCLVHAALPFLFETTASRIIQGLHHRMVVARAKDSAKNAVLTMKNVGLSRSFGLNDPHRSPRSYGRGNA